MRRLCPLLVLVWCVAAACSDDGDAGGAGQDAGGSGGGAADGGTAADAAVDPCAKFGFVASGNACPSTGCASIQCDCDPFPRSLLACTNDGCIVDADCDQVCAAGSLGDALDCTDTHSVRGASDAGSDAPVGSPVGTPCSADGQCQSQRCAAPPLGKCVSGLPEAPCVDDADCAAGSCAGSKCAPWPVAWFHQLTGSGDESLGEIAQAGSQLASVGYGSDGADFGAGPLAGAGERDVFVGRIGSGGVPVGSGALFGSAEADLGQAIAARANGNLVISGRFWGTAIAFGGPALTGSGDGSAFLAELGPNSTHVFSRVLAGTSVDIQAIATSGTDIAYVSGVHKGADFGGGPLAYTGNYDGFIARLGSGGAHVWSKSFGSAGAWDEASHLAVASNGDLVVCGRLREPTDFGDGVPLGSGVSATFVARFSAAGAIQWGRVLESSSSVAHCQGLAIDGAGAIVVGGSHNGTLTAGSQQLPDAGGIATFVARYGAGGEPLDLWQLTSDQQLIARALAVRPGGNVVITGELTGSMTVGGDVELSGQLGTFVIEATAGGVPVRARVFDSSSSMSPAGAINGPNSEIVIAGSFSGSLEIDGDTHQASAYDGFAIGLSP